MGFFRPTAEPGCPRIGRAQSVSTGLGRPGRLPLNCSALIHNLNAKGDLLFLLVVVNSSFTSFFHYSCSFCN